MNGITLHWGSVMIPLLVLLPNLLWLLWPAGRGPGERKGQGSILLEGLENVGRIGVTVIPLFYQMNLTLPTGYIWLAIMGVCLTCYYMGWLRYFWSGRERRLLFLPLGNIPIPIPMAISPIFYFFAAAGLMNSWIMALAALILALGHIPISYREYWRIKHLW